MQIMKLLLLEKKISTYHYTVIDIVKVLFTKQYWYAPNIVVAMLAANALTLSSSLKYFLEFPTFQEPLMEVKYISFLAHSDIILFWTYVSSILLLKSYFLSLNVIFLPLFLLFHLFLLSLMLIQNFSNCP